jgi:hypothetical protein
VRDGIEDKRNLLVAEMLRYFGETRPALAVRWAVGRLPSSGYRRSLYES